MNLFETKAAYQAGMINKPHYIETMYQWHHCLFDYAEFIRGTDISNIEVADGAVVMTSRTTGIKILCNRDDRRVAPIEILNFDSYEQCDFNMIIKLVQGLCNSGREINFFDIGSNIGWYSLNIAKLFKNANVFAFEPIPTTFGCLRQNIELNRLSSNIISHNFGFSNCEQTVIFYYYPEGSGNASCANLAGRADAQKISGYVKQLDDFVSDNNLTVDFIKCDVEGAELFVYQGGIESIKRDNPLIFTEMLRKWSAKFNYHPNEIIDLLTSLGYKCFTTKGQQQQLVEFFSMDENTVETNFFFLHTVKHIDLINSQSSPSISPDESVSSI